MLLTFPVSDNEPGICHTARIDRPSARGNGPGIDLLCLYGDWVCFAIPMTRFSLHSNIERTVPESGIIVSKNSIVSLNIPTSPGPPTTVKTIRDKAGRVLYNAISDEMEIFCLSRFVGIVISHSVIHRT